MKLSFARFEFKYLLPPELRADVEREIHHFMELDPYVAGCQNHKYFVRSLYFDDSGYSSYFEKRDGIHTRSKFRVRTYSEHAETAAPVFLELKTRSDNRVSKHRVHLGSSIESKLHVSPMLENTILRRESDKAVRDSFECSLYRKRLRPSILVDYYRRPYISKYDPEFRITFDEGMRGVWTDSLFPSNLVRSRRMRPGTTILEIKFQYRIPAWFLRIIQGYELRRTSVSKMCEALEAVGLVSELGD